jgi:hypothetical protein
MGIDRREIQGSSLTSLPQYPFITPMLREQCSAMPYSRNRVIPMLLELHFPFDPVEKGFSLGPRAAELENVYVGRLFS